MFVLYVCTTLCMRSEGACVQIPLSRGRLSVFLSETSGDMQPRHLEAPEPSALPADGCVLGARLEVLISTVGTDLHTELRPPFITAKSWLGRVTRWDWACHPDHTLCQLKLFFISWMIDSFLIVLLFFFSLCEAWTWTWEPVDSVAAGFGEKKGSAEWGYGLSDDVQPAEEHL